MRRYWIELRTAHCSTKETRTGVAAREGKQHVVDQQEVAAWRQRIAGQTG